MELTALTIEEKFVELFEKYMETPNGTSQVAFRSAVFHNLEYIRWQVSHDGHVLFLRGDYSSTASPEPLGMFQGQHDNLSEVEKSFQNWIESLQHYATSRIYGAMQHLFSMKIPVDYVQLPRIWSLILPPCVFGLIRVVVGDPPRAFSSARYGRFVEFSL